MNKLDKKIIKLARQTKCPIRKEYEERIDFLLETVKKDKNDKEKPYRLSLFRARYVVCILIVVFICSVPATAAIDYVQERMSKMSKEDREKYAELVTEATTDMDMEAIRYSRELSQQEQERYKELFTKYEAEGVFPSGEIKIVDNVENKETDFLLYESQTRIIYLPERNLTDEELLEIIDFYHKEDYSLSQSDEVKKLKEEEQKRLENARPGEEAMTKEAVLEKASACLEGMFNVDSTEMEKSIDYSEIIEEYAVIFNEGTEQSYEVWMDAKDGTLLSIILQKQGIDFHATPAKVDEEQFISNYERAKELFMNIFGSDTKIAGCTCEYKVDEEGNIPRGNVLYYFELPNGEAYRFYYNVNENLFWNVVYYPGYRTIKELEEKEEGIREKEENRVVIPIVQ